MPRNGLNTNEIRLGGIVLQVEAIRRTPAGLPVRAFTLEHQSELSEAGLKRRAACRIRAVAIDLPETEAALISPGVAVVVAGFIARDRTERENRLILHVRRVEVIAGETD